MTEFTIEQKRAMAMAAARKRAAAAKKPEPKARTVAEDVQAIGQRTLKGQTLGFGDEIAGVGRAALDYVMPNSTFEGVEGDSQSFGDRYRTFRDDARAVDKRFSEDRPLVAAGLELAGGVLSPTNLVAPGVGTTGTTGARVGALTGRGAVEGGVYGLGEGEGSAADQLASAATGAATGGVAAGTLSGVVGGLGRTLSKRRVANDLVQPDGSFMPLNLADQEGGIGRIYRDTLGRIPFARGELIRQEKPFVDAAEQGLQDVTRQADDVKNTIRERARVATDDIKGQYDTRVQAVKDTAEQTGPRLKNAAKAAKRAESARFAAQAYPQTLPPHGQHALEGVDTSNPEAVSSAVIKWWTGPEAFAEVKTNVFPWRGAVDPKVKASISTLLKENPDLALEANGAVRNVAGKVNVLDKYGHTTKVEVPGEADFLQRMLGETPDPEMVIAEIDGEALMALRNTFAQTANKSGKRPARAIANQLDDYIRTHLDELDPELTKQFNNSLAQYGTAKQLVRAAGSKKVRKTGELGPDEWLAASKDPRARGVMTDKRPPLDAEAAAASRRIAALKDGVADGKDAARQTKARGLVAARRARDAQKASEAASERVAKGQHADFVKGPLRNARQLQRDTNRSRVPQHVSPWSSLAAAGAAGAATPFLGAAPTLALAGGVLGGRAMVSKKGQLAVAGQLEIQKKLAEALRRGDTAKYTQLLSRLMAGQATGE